MQNPSAKVIGLSWKDRSAILAPGRAADAAYWYDQYTDHWVTSSYYLASAYPVVSANHNREDYRVARPGFPKTLREFQSKFATEEACQQYLAACRWPDGFVCPKCGDRRAYQLANLRRWQCAGCRYQVSLTAGTILHNTRTPLTLWFWAAYLMTTDKRGLSALLLQRQLALPRYETAWMILHKFRRAMINVKREPLRGEVEVDETWVGGTQAGLRGSANSKVGKRP
jgi:transposase-like protein